MIWPFRLLTLLEFKCYKSFRVKKYRSHGVIIIITIIVLKPGCPVVIDK